MSLSDWDLGFGNLLTSARDCDYFGCKPESYLSENLSGSVKSSD